MDKIFTAIILISFLGLASLGPLAMAGMEGHNDCLAVTAQGGSLPCPDNGWAVLNLHLGALQFLSLAILVGLAGLFILLFSATGNGVLLPGHSLWSHRFPLVQKYRAMIRHWFTLHENSPNTLP